jgi:hypothetical protein
VIGSDYSQFRIQLACCFTNVAIEPSFTDWLFEEAAKGVSRPEIAQSPPPSIEQVIDPEPSRDASSNNVNDLSSRRTRRGPRYQHAITQALPPTSTSAQKRTASARSPSPTNHPKKSRRKGARDSSRGRGDSPQPITPSPKPAPAAAPATPQQRTYAMSIIWEVGLMLLYLDIEAHCKINLDYRKRSARAQRFGLTLLFRA